VRLASPVQNGPSLKGVTLSAACGGNELRHTTLLTVAHAPPQEADVQYLLQLLRLLPPLRSGENVWVDFNQATAGYDFLHDLEWMNQAAERLASGAGTSADIRSLAGGCLAHFNVADNPDACRVLDRGSFDFHPGVPGTNGARWASSVCETAWRLYVRSAGSGEH
jgi:hypothetical protein